MLSPTRDRLTATLPFPIPAEADRILRATGVPHDAVLDGWVGPTVFSSELSEGSTCLLAQRWPVLASHKHAHSVVLGLIREQDSDLEHAAFVLERDVGSVFLVDLDGHVSRFVNSDLERFLRCLEAFVAWWDESARAPQRDGSAGPEEEDFERGLQVLASTLGEIDSRCLADVDAYWPAWIDDLRTL